MDVPPEFPAVGGGNLELFIDHDPGHCLPLLPGKDLCLGPVQFKPHGAQKTVCLVHNLGYIKIP